MFGVLNAAGDCVIRYLCPLRALRPRTRFRKNAVLIVDGALTPPHNQTADTDGYRGSLIMPHCR